MGENKEMKQEILETRRKEHKRNKAMKKSVRFLFGRIVITVLCLLIQILWFVFIINELNDYYAAFSTVMRVLSLILVFKINERETNPGYKIVWTVAILALPIFGALLYIGFGRSGVSLKTARRYEAVCKKYETYLNANDDILNELIEKHKRIGIQSRYIRNQSAYPVYRNTDITYYGMADDILEDLKSALRSAKQYIFMEYYAIQDASIFGEIEEILLEKVKEGVKVRIIYDDFGSISYVGPKFMRRLNEQGIECRVFNPLVPFFYVFMNNRDHRKITIVDGKVSFNGGFNLADEYFNRTHPYGKWKDTGIRLTGDAVRSHVVMFLQMWHFIKETEEDCKRYFPEETYKAIEQEGFVQPYVDSPLDNERVGENVYLGIIKNAKDYVYIYTPYLIIDDQMTDSLCLAAKSGIDVRIVTPGIPDKKFIYMVTQSYYQPLLEAGVKIYEYLPGFIHSKCFISDDVVSVVGSINLDYRSLNLQFESATYLYKIKAIEAIKQDFMETFSQSKEVTLNKTRKRNIMERMVQCILRLFAPLM